ncbi:kelch-like protein 7 isoform 3-T3 [Cyanocitta cristata]
MAAPGSEKSSKKKTEKKLAAREEAKLLASFMGVMNAMRKQKTLCDVILMVQERKIPAHRVVLASASHFFNLMFTTNMIESKSFEVELKDAEPDIIEQLVEFAYTARISVNSNNVQSLLDAANQYQIEPVKKMCVDFLKEQVDASNCLGISVLAECLDCPELKATADDFIHQHFTEVYKTDEFLQLDVKRVTHLLNQDTLTVRAEDQVYDAAVRWLKYDEPNRQPYMVDILAKVRFPLISKNFLSKTVQAEPLIQDNPECLKMVISGMRYHLLSPEDREELVEGTRPRRKKHDYRIALFGGSQPQSCRYFNPKIDAVKQLAEQWENWLIQWKALIVVAKAALLSAFKTTGTQAAPAFGMGGQQTSSFGLSSFPVSSSSTSASSFSFKTSSSLVSSASSGSSPAAGSSSAAGNPPAFGATSPPSAPQSLGFGSPAAPSAASFSFKTAATAGGFGTSGFSGFGSASAVNSASTTPLPAFGAFSAAVATSASPSSAALFGQSASASGHPVSSASAAATNSSPASEKLFTPKSELSAEEWQQFEAKEFTIGKIPLKPPPLELLNAFDLLNLF